jgi:mannose-6-phosphate isomerase
MSCSPVKFRPIFKERIWGSDRLKRLYGKELPADAVIGESWELADLPDDKSVVANGPWSGMNVRQLLGEHGQELGFTQEQCEFPFGLLIKFLDANNVLSVQVHPDGQACRKFPEAQLKTECWYVLEAQSDSVIYRGLKPDVSREKLQQALTDGNVEELMEKYPVKKGDFHFLPAGTIHALGAGVVVAEIQTPSDTTYRLYDWNRLDSQGRSRPLHIEQALESIHYTYSGCTPPTGNKTHNSPGDTAQILKEIANKLGSAKLLVDCPYFSVVYLLMDENTPRQFNSNIPFVMIALSGSGIVGNNGDPENGCQYNAGDTILIPATAKGCLAVRQSGQFLLTCLGPVKVK